MKTIEPVLIESRADADASNFPDAERKETENTQEETEWETYEAGWNEGYESSIVEARTVAARVLSRF